MIANPRFALSLDLVELESQEPNRNRRESKYYWDELFTLIPAAGFRAVEIPYQPKWDFGGRSGVPLTMRSVTTKYGTVDAFLKVLKADGIERIAGVSFSPVLFAGAPGDAFFGAYRHFASEAVAFAGEAGADVLTVTPTPPVGLLEHHRGDSAAWSGDFLKKLADLLNDLAKEAAANGTKLSLKSEYWSLLRGERIDAFAKGLDPSIRLDVDTAHLAIAGLDPAKRAAAIGGRIGSVHLTDTAFVDAGETWRTPSPEFPAGRATQVFRDLGAGTVDLAAACRAVEETGYEGWYVCSCRQTRDACRAMLRTRSHVDRVLSKA